MVQRKPGIKLRYFEEAVKNLQRHGLGFPPKYLRALNKSAAAVSQNLCPIEQKPCCLLQTFDTHRQLYKSSARISEICGRSFVHYFEKNCQILKTSCFQDLLSVSKTGSVSHRDAIK